jgi:membrane-bound serine protease (ClpP class)
MTIGITGSFLGAMIAFKILPKTGAYHGIILTASETKEGGYSSLSKPLKRFLGNEGEALTPLRPAGKAIFGEHILDVVTEGDFIERGTRVKVITIEGGRVVVESSHRI